MTTTGSTRTRRPAAKKAAAPAYPTTRMSGVEVVELFTQEAQDREPDLVEIFRIDGIAHCMDRNQDAGVALEYLHLVRTRGENVGLSYLFEEVMGEEAYTALRSFKGITPAQLGQVMMAVQTVMLGSQSQAPKAQSPRG